jgi:hypothetical protein
MMRRPAVLQLPASSQPLKFRRVMIGRSLPAGGSRIELIAPGWGTLPIVASPTARAECHVKDCLSIRALGIAQRPVWVPLSKSCLVAVALGTLAGRHITGIAMRLRGNRGSSAVACIIDFAQPDDACSLTCSPCRRRNRDKV